MNVSEALIREIVTKVLEESAGKGSKPEFEKHIDPSGIIGIKTSSKENRMMYWLRSCYYKTIKKLSDVEQIEHFRPPAWAAASWSWITPASSGP